MPIPVLYGIFDFEGGRPQLVAMKEDMARRYANNIRLLRLAKTWSELKAGMHEEDYRSLCQDFLDNQDDAFYDEDGTERSEPDGDIAFDNSFIDSEYGYETWIVDPLADMVHWVPKEIQDYLGSVEPADMFCNHRLDLNPKIERWIINAFAKNGYTARRDDAAVAAAFDY